MKLIYFSGRGRAECARLLLAVGGIEYENVRIKMEEWPTMKDDMPFGQLPVLEVDGGVIAQSNAICRFIAKKAGLYGKDDLEQASIDMIIDFIGDLLAPMMKVAYPRNEEAKAADVKAANEEAIPNFVSRAEKLLKKNGGKNFVGKRLTWADVAMFEILRGLVDPSDPVYTKYIKNRLGNARLKALDDAPALKELVDSVGALPPVKKWIESRPNNEDEPF